MGNDVFWRFLAKISTRSDLPDPSGLLLALNSSAEVKEADDSY